MKNRSQLVRGTRLEERMLHVGEGAVDPNTLGGDVRDTILVDLEVSDGLPPFEVWLDDNVLQGLSPSVDHLQRLQDVLLILFLVLLLVLDLGFLDQVFDLLLGQSQVVVLPSLVLVFEGQLLDEDSVGVSHVREEESARLADGRRLEVDSEEGPLALARLGDVVDSADVERDELLRVDWHQDGEVLLVDEELAFLESLWESFHGRVGLDEPHILLLLLFL